MTTATTPEEIRHEIARSIARLKEYEANEQLVSMGGEKANLFLLLQKVPAEYGWEAVDALIEAVRSR